MANATFNQEFRTRERGKLAMLVADAVQLYAGMLVGTDVAGGFLNLWNNVATTNFAGLTEEDKLGATASLVTARVDVSGKVLVGVPVAGATQAKVMTLVYCQTSNPKADLTTTAATSRRIGILVAFRTASDCDVQLFTPSEFQVIA